MKKQILFTALLLIAVSIANAQSSQPWLLNGNNNVTDTSKLGSLNQKPVRFVTANQEWMRLTTVGYLGIGTTTPTSRLHVATTSTIPATFDGGAGMFIKLNEGGVYRGYIGSLAGAATDMDFGTGVGNTAGKLHLTIQNAPKLTVDANGNIGIGTIAPTSLLSVNKASAGVATADFRNTSIGPNISWIHFGSTGDWYIRSAANNGNIIMQDQSSGGRVGIGTTSPAYKLDVCGTVRAKEMRVETGWCDYVFEDNYKLASLKEVETFIKKNKHLPEVSPGAQIENNGLEVGKVSSQMIKKIEELTLYVIELQKQVDALKSHQQ